ncbi:hypothetical protein BRC82_09505 [Halobacteriales archaeon QS_1_67_19]|nr:MAG: hypothetical protein BRC82_09505 [Halobacteriales archaeon QS_1_67_19]
MSSHKSILTLIVIIAVVVSVVPQFGLAGQTTPSTAAHSAPTTAEADRTTTTNEPTTASSTAPTAAEIRATAIEASRDVDTYRVRSIINRTISTDRINRTAEVTARGVFNRTARELRTNQTTSTPMRTVNSTTYVVDESLYVRSNALVRQYSSEWVTTNLSGEIEARWRLLDTVTRQRVILANSSVRRVGTTTLNGTEAYVLEADVNETSYGRALQTQFSTTTRNVTNASFTFWIARESGHILQSQGTVTSTATLRGQPVTISERLRLRFDDYDEPVTVTLPDAAATAVEIGNETTTTTQRDYRLWWNAPDR